MITVHFNGGPRHGQTKQYAQNPIIIGCVSEAIAKGMWGIYKTDSKSKANVLVAHWRDIVPEPGQVDRAKARLAQNRKPPASALRAGPRKH